jgi:hypothetical protein
MRRLAFPMIALNCLGNTVPYRAGLVRDEHRAMLNYSVATFRVRKNDGLSIQQNHDHQRADDDAVVGEGREAVF